MNITTILDIIVILNIIIIAVTFIIETFSFKKNVKKSLEELIIRFNDYTVQNEHDKLEIYKRLADLEEELKNG